MKTSRIAQIIENLNKTENFPTLEVASLVDEKVESDMEKVLDRLDNMETSLTTRYNVLIGMMTFLGTVITVISIVIGLK